MSYELLGIRLALCLQSVATPGILIGAIVAGVLGTEVSPVGSGTKPR